MLDGWIKLHRKIRENPIFNDMQLFRLWIICLTEATYKERDQMVGKQLAHLMPGEFVTGRFSLNELYNSGLGKKENKPPTTTWRWLEVLESNGFVVIKSNNKYSVVSILKWVDYQQSEDQDGQQSGQQVVNNLSTDGQQVVTNKKVKKVNNAKKVKEEVIKDIYAEKVFLSTDEYEKLIIKYGSEELTKAAIEKLSNYKCSKDTKYKSDYHVLIGWVFDDFEKRKLIVLKGGQADASKPEQRRPTTANQYYANDQTRGSQASIQSAASGGSNYGDPECDLDKLFVRR